MEILRKGGEKVNERRKGGLIGGKIKEIRMLEENDEESWRGRGWWGNEGEFNEKIKLEWEVVFKGVYCMKEI